MKQRLFISIKFLVKVAIATILPLIVFAYTGKLVDNWLKTGPWFLITGGLFSFFTTIYWLAILTKKLVKKIDNLN